MLRFQKVISKLFIDTRPSSHSLILQRWNLKVESTSYNFYIIIVFVLFQDFVIGLSILVRGTMEEKVRWMFTLYDQDRDGYISRFDYIFFHFFE